MMLELKDYQERTLDVLDHYLKTLKLAKEAADELDQMLAERGKPPRRDNWCENAWKTLAGDGCLPGSAGGWLDRRDGTNAPIPSICLKIPTGGGKTLLGVHAVERINTRFFNHRRNGLVLWFVPSTAIHDQTLRNFKNQDHPCRAVLRRASNINHIKVITRETRFTRHNVDAFLTIMLLSLQGSARQTREQLRMFQQSGGYTNILPYHENPVDNNELLEQIPNLETYEDTFIGQKRVAVRHSLANALRVIRPIIVIDESHRARGEIRFEQLNDFNPRFILELSATPDPARSNILVDVGGQALKNEEMIKLPINLNNVKGDDWKGTLAKAHDKLKKLDRQAQRAQAANNRYIRPIMLVRVERTGREQRGKGFLHAEDAREHLITKLGMRPDQVRVQASEVKELDKDEDLLSPTNPVRAIITKQALQEGWDCPFAYVLALLSKSTAQTALTQMIGRILRQPHASATGIDDLDQSHVFCFDQEVDKAIGKIKALLEKEGLGDLADGVRYNDPKDSTGQEAESVRRRKKFKNLSILLPRVLHKKGARGWRRLNYERDILQPMPWEDMAYSQASRVQLKDLKTMRASHTQIGLPGEETAETTARDLPVEEKISPAFFATPLSDVIPNPWQAARIAAEALDTLKRRNFSRKNLYAERMTLLDHMKGDLEKQVEEQAKSGFLKKLQSGAISFNLEAVNDPNLAWKAPQTIKVATRLNRNNNEQLQLTLFEKVEETGFNNLEKQVAWYLDEEKALEWWHRVAARHEYGLQGWRKHKVYPDFLASIRKTGKRAKTIAVLETKGTHLKNEDTEYKAKLFSLLENAAGKPLSAGKVKVSGNARSMIFRILWSDQWKQQIRQILP